MVSDETILPGRPARKGPAIVPRRTRHERATQPRHAADHLREPDGHRRLRVRRIRGSGRGQAPRAARTLPAAWASAPCSGTSARDITVYRQGGVNFLVNEDPDSFAADFARAHGPSACGFAIRFQQPVRRGAAHRARQRWRGDRRQGSQQGDRRAGGQGHRRLHAVPGGPLRRRGQRVRRRLRADPGRRAGSEGLRPDLHRPPHAQPVLRQHAEVVGLLRAPVQLPRDPLLRHQGRQDRPGVQGDDRAGRRRAHPAQRIQRPEVADQRVPRRLQGRGHPAHRLLHRRHLRHGREDARVRASSSWTPRTPTST